jgi:hypothetical protein
MTVKELELAISELPADDQRELMAWIDKYRAEMWDKQIEEDLANGRLDSVLREVEQEYEAGHSKPL